MKSLYLLLTDQCNLHCSFCYKKELTESASNEKMSPKEAIGSIEWAIANGLFDPSDRLSTIHFWGGEPLCALDTVKCVLEEYPQLHFSTTTNGLAVNEETAEFFYKHLYHLRITLSLGSVYDKFDGLESFIKRNRFLIDKIVASENKWGVNLMVVKPERLYDDFLLLHSRGIQSITVDMPTHTVITDEFKDEFVKNYLRIFEDFNINKKFAGKIFDGKALKECGLERKQYRYCGSGVERILIDFRGSVYPCDGLYNAHMFNLGNINEDFDFKGLDFFNKLSADPSSLYEACVGCEIADGCPRAKCMGINHSLTGDIRVLDANWCKICKAFYEVGEKYEKLKSQKEKVEAYV